MQVDMGLLDTIGSYTTRCPPAEGPIDGTRVFHGCSERGLCKDYIKSEDLNRLRNPSSQLNNVCVNLTSTVVHFNLWDDVSSKCAIMSSFIMTCIEDGANTDTVWKNTRFLSYWEHKVWLIPIHRRTQYHWMLCVVYVDEGKVHIFDSLASRESAQSILSVSPLPICDKSNILAQPLSKLLAIMIHNCTRHGYCFTVQLPRSWTARPIIVSTLIFLSLAKHPSRLQACNITTSTVGCGYWSASCRSCEVITQIISERQTYLQSVDFYFAIFTAFHACRRG